MKINLLEDDNNVIQGDPEDASVDLVSEILDKFTNVFRSSRHDLDNEVTAFMKEITPNDMLAEHYISMGVDEDEHHHKHYTLRFTFNYRMIFNVSDKPTETTELVIPGDFFIDCVGNLRNLIYKHIPEITQYQKPFLNYFTIQLYDFDIYTKELYKGREMGSGIIALRDFNSGTIKETLTKKIRLVEFLEKDPHDYLSVKNNIVLSQDYRQKRDTLIRKGQVLFKHFGKGTFQGKQYELDYKYPDIHISDNAGYGDNRYIEQEGDAPVLRSKHIKMSMNYFFNIIIDGEKYILRDLRDVTRESPQELQDIVKYVKDLNNAILKSSKPLGIEISINI